jgi:hypothetical protein
MSLPKYQSVLVVCVTWGIDTSDILVCDIHKARQQLKIRGGNRAGWAGSDSGQVNLTQ